MRRRLIWADRMFRRSPWNPSLLSQFSDWSGWSSRSHCSCWSGAGSRGAGGEISRNWLSIPRFSQNRGTACLSPKSLGKKEAMETITSILVVLFGLLLRIGVPLGITILLVWWLRRLDTRWQKESAREMAKYALKKPRNAGCWKVNGCSPEKRAACKAFARQETPCWQVFRNEDGKLRESCLGCQVFQAAPVPAQAGD